MTLKKIWRNEYFQTAIMIILINGIVFGFWYGIQFALKTEYPLLTVASTSMLPTLNVGDLIIVQGVPATQINANYTTGDIVVFRYPGNPDYRIVHRAIEKELRADGYWITTHGDNNPLYSNEGPFHEDYLIGKVVGRIPYVGNFPLLVHTQQNMYYFTILLIILIVMIFMFLVDTDKKEQTTEKERTQKKSKLFGKLDIKIVYLVVPNLLLICIIVFSLQGAFTFWQIGADPPQYVTIRGMYPDVQFHESFKLSHNNVSKVLLSQGFLTYGIDCSVSDGLHEGIRPGVPTFSWTQGAIIVLILFDVWELIKFSKLKKTVETRTET